MKAKYIQDFEFGRLFGDGDSMDTETPTEDSTEAPQVPSNPDWTPGGAPTDETTDIGTPDNSYESPVSPGFPSGADVGAHDFRALSNESSSYVPGTFATPGTTGFSGIRRAFSPPAERDLAKSTAGDAEAGTNSFDSDRLLNRLRRRG
jgi:hypothetical protein